MKTANAPRPTPALWCDLALDVIKKISRQCLIVSFWTTDRYERDPRTVCKSARLVDEFSQLNENPNEIKNKSFPK